MVDDGSARGATRAPARSAVAEEFEYGSEAVVLASGGIGGNHDLVRSAWPERLGTPPRVMLTGVPAYVDGSMFAPAELAGARVVNRDRMWHYVEGIANHAPVWPGHAVRILAGPSSMWFDGEGRRLPHPFSPGFDTLGTLEHLRRTGHEHSWFVTNRRIVGKEFALSGSEQNPDLTGRSIRQVLNRLRTDVPAPVQAFVDRGVDFVQADTVPDLVRKMNTITPEAPLDVTVIVREVDDRDREMGNPRATDAQVLAIREARRYLGDRLVRTAAPHRITDPQAGPLVAVRLRILTRKTLGGFETDLGGRVLGHDGTPIPGLYAAGEVAGFGGGGLHGYRALEGTFLGGCLFTGLTVGRELARALA